VGACLAAVLVLSVLVLQPWQFGSSRATSTGLSRTIRRVERQLDRLATRLERQQELRRSAALERAFERGQAVRIRLPHRDINTGQWMQLERALGQFARSNKVEIIRFENAGSELASVCVWAKDAAAMRRFVASFTNSTTELAE
jgi:hypothetical protein